MPYRRLVYTLTETLLRIAVIGMLVGGAWVVLQFYTEDEVLRGARDFWAWWSTRFSGELAQYWNPAGAAITLSIAAMFVLSPFSRLFRGRRRYGSNNHGGDDHGGGDDGGDSGGD